MLSTEMFDGPQTRIRDPRRTSCWISSIRVCVFPVPGGPCISDISRDARACWIAACWEGFRESCVYLIGAAIYYGVRGVGVLLLNRTCVKAEVVAGVSFCRRFIV
jgi:hypothetical protein